MWEIRPPHECGSTRSKKELVRFGSLSVVSVEGVRLANETSCSPCNNIITRDWFYGWRGEYYGHMHLGVLTLLLCRHCEQIAERLARPKGVMLL